MAITTQLLDALLSSGPSRQEAEAHFNSLELVDRIQGLVTVVSLPQTQPDHILIASVLLRRDIATVGGQALQQLISPQNALHLLKNLIEPLLYLFQSLRSAPCRRQVGYCIAEIICSLSLLSEQDSQTTLQAIFTTIGSTLRNADPVSLRLLANIAERSPSILCKAAPDVMGMLQAAISSCQNAESMAALTEALVYVAIATQVAYSGQPDAVSFLSTTRLDHLSVDSDSPAAKLGSACLVPLLERMQQQATVAQDAVHSCLQHLAHAASTCPSLLAGDVAVFSALVRTCLDIASNAGSTELALSACQVLASLTSVGYVSRRLPSQREISDLIKNGAIRICAELVVNGVDGDVEEWASETATIMDDIPTWEDDDTAMYAESLLCMFVQSLGGTQTLPVVLPMVETLLLSSDWKQERAALVMLEQCLFAAPVTFAQHVPVAVETALQLAFTSENIRVQFQAVVLLGALCEADQDLDGSIRVKYGERILQVFARMVQCQVSKVAAVACLSLVSYCRGGGDVDGASLVVPYLKELLVALVGGPLSWDVSDPGVVAVKIRAIGAVACLAQSAQEAFVPYYVDVMPGLLGCSALPSPSYEMSRLRGSAMEAATIVGQAVSESNRDLYIGDAEKIMHLAIPLLQADDASETSIPMDELLSACARIASVMGEEYAPFVSVVLPHLLTRVSAPPDMQFSEGDEAGLEATKRGDAEMNEEEGTEHLTFTVSLPGKGITKVTVNTTKILEKAQAARAIYEHAAALGAAFGPFAEATLECLVPLVNFRYSAEVRSTVASAISPVYEAACAYVESSGMQVPQKYLPLLAGSLSKQVVAEDPSDPEVMFALADSLSDVFYFAYRTLDGSRGGQILASYTPVQAKATVQCVMKAMVSCLKRRADLLRTLEGLDGTLSGEDEREEYTRALDSEREVLTPLVDVVGYTIKFLRAEAMPLFESEVAPILAPYLKSGGSTDVRARFAAVCLFDDCVEHCGSTAAAKYAPYLLEGALVGMDDSTNGQDVELKQVSVYGIAQIARYAPASVIISHADRLVNMLVNICSVPKDATDHVALVENGISALVSLVLIDNAPLGKSMNATKKSSIASTFLDQLPLREDESEAKIVHAGLCGLVESGQVQLTTESERLLRIIGELFTYISEGEDLASPDTQARLAKILFQMQNDVPADKMQASFGSLPVESQQCVNSVMNEFRAQSGANLVSP